MRRHKSLQLRLSEAEIVGFAAAAEISGIPLAMWARERLRLAAIRELESAGQKVPFVRPTPLGTPADEHSER